MSDENRGCSLLAIGATCCVPVVVAIGGIAFVTATIASWFFFTVTQSGSGAAYETCHVFGGLGYLFLFIWVPLAVSCIVAFGPMLAIGILAFIPRCQSTSGFSNSRVLLIIFFLLGLAGIFLMFFLGFGSYFAYESIGCSPYG